MSEIKHDDMSTIVEEAVGKVGAVKDDSIEVSPKYGLNTTMSICFWCGEVKGIALPGRIRSADSDDVEAPKQMVTDYDLCDKCKEATKDGILFYAVSLKPLSKNQPPISVQENTQYYPTGQYAAVKEQALKSIFNDEATIENIKNNKVAMIDVDTFNTIFGDMKEE